MAAISITAANVLASALATLEKGYAFGATVTTGQAVYLDTSVSPPVWRLMDSDAAATGNGINDIKGYAQNGGAAGQPAIVAVRDPDYTLGGTMTNGGAVWNSVTAGAADQTAPTTGSYPVVMGVAKSATKMNLNPVASGAIV